jgi:predicted component of type VI protein secretion system
MTDPRDALSYLFDKRERLSGAFLPPVQAVGDACDDLRVHEIALMAGMRAAFQGALKRFDPQLIEREADKQKGSFTLNKKVKLWETFGRAPREAHARRRGRSPQGVRQGVPRHLHGAGAAPAQRTEALAII